MKPNAVKVQDWVKTNLATIILILVCLTYIGYGLFTIGRTGKTVDEIIVGGALGLIMGFSIKVLMQKQGLEAGKLSEEFISTKKFYAQMLEEVAPHSNYLGIFCDNDNAEALKRKRIKMLRSIGLSYEDYIKGSIDRSKLSKAQRKQIKKVDCARIIEISEATLLSDTELQTDDREELSVSETKFALKRNARTMLTMVASSVIFAYYMISPNGTIQASDIVWSCFQVATYLLFGTMEYLNAYSFITKEYKTKLIRKANYLEKFNNDFKDSPKTYFPIEAPPEFNT